MDNDLSIFCGSSNPKLSNEILSKLGGKINRDIFKFPNDNTFVKLKEDIRGNDVFIIQPTSRPVNDNLMELLITIDAIKRSSAKRITAVIPYFGYARSDKKDQSGVPITAKLVSNLLTVAGADRIVTFDLHSGQIQGFFDIPLDHLSMIPIFVDYFKKIGIDTNDLVIVSPDSGGASRANWFSDALKTNIAIGNKVRNGATTKLLNIIGDVENKVCVIVDDIIDTGGSIINVANELHKRHAKKIYIAASHGVFSKNAIMKINNSCIDVCITTNSIYHDKNIFSEKFVELSIGDLLASAIQKIHNEESLSELFYMES